MVPGLQDLNQELTRNFLPAGFHSAKGAFWAAGGEKTSLQWTSESTQSWPARQDGPTYNSGMKAAGLDLRPAT